jgi:hypothetical protein
LANSSFQKFQISTQAYISAVQPSAILRTWIGNPTQPSPPQAYHNLGLQVQFSTIASGINDAVTQNFQQQFSNQPPTNASDLEFSYFIANFSDFDSLMYAFVQLIVFYVKLQLFEFFLRNDSQ